MTRPRKEATGASQTDAAPRRPSRRQMLALSAGAVAAATVTALGVDGGKKAQAGHDGTNVFHLGGLSMAGTPTHLRANVSGTPLSPPGEAVSLKVCNEAGNKGAAVLGVSRTCASRRMSDRARTAPARTSISCSVRTT
jgi:hypothetical protein